ncbi:MAG: hypothetical protein JSV09_12205 [Thermoplasmata archaeon]|nr:MAG: hypothetical protein JSV09_12205 [Thermoplasmata archaeon]
MSFNSLSKFIALYGIEKGKLDQKLAEIIIEDFTEKDPDHPDIVEKRKNKKRRRFQERGELGFGYFRNEFKRLNFAVISNEEDALFYGASPFNYDGDLDFYMVWLNTTWDDYPGLKVAQPFVEFNIKLARYLQPEFAWGDSPKFVDGYIGRDPRESVFGLTIYGPDLVSIIGNQNILELNELEMWTAEEQEWGGIVVRYNDNPFRPKAKDRKEATSKLDLKNRLKDNLKAPKPIPKKLKFNKDFWEE